jgi:uncharacterized damage-inducible protein DinB
MSTSSDLFLEFSRRKLLDEFWPRLKTAVGALTDEELWWRPNTSSNAIGNLLLHLNGNVHQWLVASFSGTPDARNRPAEFAARELASADVLLDGLDETMARARGVLDRLTEADLVRRYEIQGYTVTGLAAVYQVVEHFSMHYGQILYVIKQLRGEDLGFHRELDKTGRIERGTSR